MPIVLRLAFALDLTTIGCERIFPHWRAFLPLGGDHFTQLALLLLFAALSLEFHEIAKPTVARFFALVKGGWRVASRFARMQGRRAPRR